MGLLDEQVALITGGARGLGRSHALRLAEEGADIVVCDIAGSVDSVSYAMPSEDDLKHTAKAVRERGRRCVSVKADASDAEQMQGVIERTLEELGKLDVLVVNHAIAGYGAAWELTEQQWDDMLRINLKGAWLAAKAAVPHMIERGDGGSIVFVASVAGLVGKANLAHYAAAKHGVIGLMRSLALELGPHNVRVNAVCPGTVNTPMVHNEATYSRFTGKQGSTFADVRPAFEAMNALPVPQLEPIDVSNAIVYLASDLGRYVTGVALPVDAGSLTRSGG